MPIIEKVTAFITRASHTGHDLLLFEHPHAGIQIPAGTVENNEMPQQTVLRETAEETGLILQSISQYLGCTEDKLDRSFIRKASGCNTCLKACMAILQLD